MDSTRTVTRLLIVDDDEEILALLKKFFMQHGSEVDVAADGAAMWAAIDARRPDLVILDVMLQGEGGLSLCQRLRARGGVPIVILAAMAELSDRIVGLELGADDYVTKPFDARELLARVRAVLRRAGDASAPRPGDARPVIRFADWQLDVSRRELRSPDEVLIPLSNGEFDLLLVFVEHPQRVLSREQLLELSRGHTHEAVDRSVDVQISRLRRKIEPDARSVALIRTVRSEGYMFTPTVRRT
jgi:two-component system OmpR family response regulator